MFDSYGLAVGSRASLFVSSRSVAAVERSSSGARMRHAQARATIFRRAVLPPAPGARLATAGTVAKYSPHARGRAACARPLRRSVQPCSRLSWRRPWWGRCPPPRRTAGGSRGCVNTRAAAKLCRDCAPRLRARLAVVAVGRIPSAVVAHARGYREMQRAATGNCMSSRQLVPEALLRHARATTATHQPRSF